MTVSIEYIGFGIFKTAHFKGKSTDDKPTHDKWLRVEPQWAIRTAEVSDPPGSDLALR